MNNRSLVGLDLIRFSAAAMVAWFHLAYFQWLSDEAVSLSALAPFASFGWVGVEIFFVLSGFVIAYSAKGKSALGFAKSRFLRLYPAVWICASIAMIAGASDVEAYVRSMTLWPFGPFVDGVYWTLGIEMVFYGLVFSLLLLNGFNRLWVLLHGIGTMSALFWFAWLVDHLMGGSSFAWTMGHRYFELLLIQYGCFFSLGGTIWLIAFNERRWSHWLAGTVSFAGGLICIYCIAHAKAVANQGHNPVVPILVWVVSVAAIIASIVYEENFRPLSGKLTRTLGLATYPLYLLHHVVGVAVMTTLVALKTPDPIALAVALIAVTLLSVAALVPEVFVRTRLAGIWDAVVRLARPVPPELPSRLPTL